MENTGGRCYNVNHFLLEFRVHARRGKQEADAQYFDTRICLFGYMAGLSEVAQCYLFLCFGAKSLRSSLSEKDLAARLSLSVDDVKGALLELTHSGLIEKGDRGCIFLKDLKQVEIDGYIRAQREQSLPPDPTPMRAEDERRDTLCKSVEKTFFTGSMGYQWYREIDVLLDDFHFERDVVYRLFKDCYEKKQLRSLNQVRARALIWQAKGITRMNELSEYLAREEEISQTLIKVGKILRRKTVSYDEDCVRVWVERLGYSFEIIDFAIKKVWEYQEPSLSRADAYLKSWFASGVRTLADAYAYEEDRAKKNKQAYQKDKESIKSQKEMQNFNGVRYDDEFLNGLDTDPDEYLRKMSGDQEDRPQGE